MDVSLAAAGLVRRLEWLALAWLRKPPTSFLTAESGCVEKPGDTQKHPVQIDAWTVFPLSTLWDVVIEVFRSSPTMTKRMHEQKGEERSVAKSKSTAMNLSSHVPTGSSSAKSPIASKSPGILIATGETLKAG